MWLACQNKSYLMCDEITNFLIFKKPIPNFLLKYKTETAKQGRDSYLKKKMILHNISEIHYFVTYKAALSVRKQLM